MATEYCLTVGITKEFKERLQKEAKNQSRTMSALVKAILETYLNSIEDTTPDVDWTTTIIKLQQDVSYLQSEWEALKEKVLNQNMS